MSDDAAASVDQEPLPKKPKLCTNTEEEAAGTDGGARPAAEKGEPPAIMLGGLICKFLKEADVGITEYVSTQSGFFAILKQRWAKKFERFVYGEFFLGIRTFLSERYLPVGMWLN